MSTVPAPENRKRRWLWPLITAAALLTGILLGTASSSAEDTTTATPEPTQTVTAEPVVETQEVTPLVCVVALDEADLIKGAFDFLLDWIDRYLGAVSEFDVTAMDALTDEMAASTDSGEYAGVLPAYEAAAAACRAVA